MSEIIRDKSKFNIADISFMLGLTPEAVVNLVARGDFPKNIQRGLGVPPAFWTWEKETVSAWIADHPDGAPAPKKAEPKAYVATGPAYSMNISQVARLLRTTVEQVRKRLAAGKIPAPIKEETWNSHEIERHVFGNPPPAVKALSLVEAAQRCRIPLPVFQAIISAGTGPQQIVGQSGPSQRWASDTVDRWIEANPHGVKIPPPPSNEDPVAAQLALRPIIQVPTP